MGQNSHPTVVAGALSPCVHVAGVLSFLRLAEAAGWHTVFLGPAATTQAFLDAARDEGADLVGVSYRLTPETGQRLLSAFAEAADELRESGVRFVFAGTPAVARTCSATGGVPVRGIESIVRLACIIHRTDYWRRGRTVDKLGLERLSVGELTQYVKRERIAEMG